MGGARRVRYRHLKRTVIAVLATVAFVLLFGLVIRTILEAPPTRRMAINWLEQLARGYGAELEIDRPALGHLAPQRPPQRRCASKAAASRPKWMRCRSTSAASG